MNYKNKLGNKKREKILNNLNYGSYNDLIKHFINVLETQGIDLNTFYCNLKKLKIVSNKEDEKDKNILNNLKISRSAAYYHTIDNTIYLKGNYYDYVVYHELLHVASVKNITTHESILDAATELLLIKLDEGYTEFLNKRYFNQDILKYTGYSYELRIAELLEYLIGKSNMEKYYFNNDINNIIVELSTLFSEKEIIKLGIFINKKHYIKTIRQILFKPFFEKLNNDLNNNIITQENYIDLASKFLYCFGIKSIKNNNINYNNEVICKWEENEIKEADDLLEYIGKNVSIARRENYTKKKKIKKLKEKYLKR